MKKTITLVLITVFSLFTVGSTFAAFPLNEQAPVKTKKVVKPMTKTTQSSNKAQEITTTSNNAETQVASIDNNWESNYEVSESLQIEKQSQVGHALSGGKSQLVALILAIFLGALGIHRFYLGYTLIGIIQLLTAGGLGIWLLIDIIRIATGDLEPKDGSYSDTFL